MMQSRNDKRARLLPSAALDVLSVSKDLLVRCALYLDSDGLAQLGRTSARFGIPQTGHQRSWVNEMARRLFLQSATDEERSRVPKYVDESDIGLYRALEQLRQPLRFDELLGYWFSPQERPASVTCTNEEDNHCYSTATSRHVIRGGKHFVEFVISEDNGYTLRADKQEVLLGIIRPVSLTNNIDLSADWEGSVDPVLVSLDPESSTRSELAAKLRSQRTRKWGDSDIHCCVYTFALGGCSWTDWNEDEELACYEWQVEQELGDYSKVGLLLDLDEGTLSVFRNGRCLGVMKKGLSGEYCWFISAASSCTIQMSRGQVPSADQRSYQRRLRHT